MSIVNQKESVPIMATSSQFNQIDDEIEHQQPTQNIYDKFYNFAGKLAATNFGQFAIEKMDKILSVCEKTAKWSLPQTENNPDDKSITSQLPPLERPCSWLPFLLLIITLRIIRVTLSFGAILIGNKPVTPSSMVYFIQQRRRKLRAVKYHGVRVLRMKNQDLQKQRGIIEKLSSIFNMVICRPGRCQPEIPSQLVIVNNSKNSKDTNSINKEFLNANQKRPLEKDDEFETDDDLPVDKLLDKYGNEASDVEDADFIPEQDPKSDISSSSSDSELSDTEELLKRLKELKTKEDENTKIEENNVKLTNNVSNDLMVGQQHVETELLEHSEPESNQSTKISPKIAQNGIDDDQFYDTSDCCRDHTLLDKGFVHIQEQQQSWSGAGDLEDSYYSPIGSPNFIGNNLETTPINVDQQSAVADNSTTDNHVKRQPQQTNKQNNKKHYNNNIYYRHNNKGKR